MNKDFTVSLQFCHCHVFMFFQDLQFNKICGFCKGQNYKEVFKYCFHLSWMEAAEKRRDTWWLN